MRKYLLVAITFALSTLMAFATCKSEHEMKIINGPVDTPLFSPNTLLIMYDKEVGKAPLLEAIREYGAELIYDYGKACGVAIRKPDAKTIEETIAFFKKVKGVTHVSRDRILKTPRPGRRGIVTPVRIAPIQKSDTKDHQE